MISIKIPDNLVAEDYDSQNKDIVKEQKSTLLIL
jgi:hypothetical protein